MALLEVQNIVKRYSKRDVVDNISLSIEAGDVVGILGENGAGKSTFMAMVATLIKPTSGDILYNGESIVKKPGIIRGKIGYVPQDIALYEELSGIDNLKYWARTYHLSHNRLEQAVENIIGVIGLDRDKLKDKVSLYSGGMKRRVNIGIALLNDPEVIIMDEPTVGIDIMSKEEILKVISVLNKQGKTVIYSAHYFEELEQICNKICIMMNGKVMEFSNIVDIIGDDPIKKSKLTEYYLHKYQGNVFLS